MSNVDTSPATTSAAAQRIPGYEAATWTIDPVHSEVGFSVRHMMVSKVRGKFTEFSGEFVIGADPLDSSVTASIDLRSIDTGNADANPSLGGLLRADPTTR
jgi:polyisoprenoid-binding protein YceI